MAKKYAYLNRKILKSILEQSSNEIDNFLLVCSCFEFDNKFLLTQSDKDKEKLIEDIYNYYTPSVLEKLPFCSEELCLEFLLRPYLLDKFVDVLNGNNVTVFEKLQLGVLAEQVKQYPLGLYSFIKEKIETLKNQPAKKFNETLYKYAYAIVIAVYHATHLVAAKTIPLTLTFDEDIYNYRATIPARLALETNISLENRIKAIEKQNEVEKQRLHVLYGNAFKSINELYSRARGEKIEDFSTFYFDDTQNFWNKRIAGPIKAKTNVTKVSKSMILAYIAVQDLVLNLNGVFAKISALSRLDDAIFMTEKLAKNHLQNKLMIVFYYQHIFEIVLRHVKEKCIEDAAILDNTKSSAKDCNDARNRILNSLNEVFEGPLFDTWVSRVKKICNFEETIYENKAVRTKSNIIYVTPFVGVFCGQKLPEAFFYTESVLNNNKNIKSIIVEDYLSRSYNSLGALVSTLIVPQGYNATRQSTILSNEARFIGLLLDIMSGGILAIDQLLASRGIKKFFDRKLSFRKIAATHIEECILSRASHEILNEWTFEDAFKLFIDAFKKYITAEFRNEEDQETLNCIKKEFKIKNIEELYQSKMFIVALAFGFVIYRFDTFTSRDVKEFLQHYGLYSYEELGINEFLKDNLAKIITSKDGVIETFSNVNRIFINTMINKFFDTYYPLAAKVSHLSNDLRLVQKEILEVKVDIRFSVLGKLEGEYFDQVKNKVSSIYTLATFFDKVIKFHKEFLSITEAEFTREGKAVKSLTMTHIGYETHLNGEKLKYKPLSPREIMAEYDRTKKLADVFKIIKDYNDEQSEILMEDIASLPLVQYYGYNVINGVQVEIPTTKPRDLKNHREVNEYRKVVKAFNEAQEKAWTDDLKSLPPINDLKFRATYNNIDLLAKIPTREDYKIKHAENIKKLRAIIESFNLEQEKQLVDHIKHLPTLIDYNFKLRANGKKTEFGVKPFTTIDRIKNQKDWKESLKAIIKWNEIQEKYLQEYIDSIPPIIDLGFSKGETNCSAQNTKPLITKARLESLEGIIDLTKEINIYNREQLNLLEQEIARLPKIINLGFTLTGSNTKLRHKRPDALDKMRVKLVNFPAVRKYAKLINNFNREQQHILEDFLKIIPKIHDLGYNVKIDGTNLECPKPTFNYSEITNKSSLEHLVVKINRFNEEQKGLHSIYKKSAIPTIVDLGFKKTTSGLAIAHQLPKMNSKNLITKELVDKFAKDVITFNMEQKNLLESYRLALPEVADKFYKAADGALNNKFPSNYRREVTDWKSYEKLNSEIKKFNESQEKAHTRRLASLPKLAEYHFLTHVNGRAIEHQRVAYTMDQVFNKRALINIEDMIYVYNMEQEAIFHEKEKVCPVVEDLGFRNYPSGAAIKCQYPKITKLSPDMNSLQINEVINTIMTFNHEQRSLLEEFRIHVPAIVDYGFGVEDGITLPHPTLPEHYDNINRDKLDNIRKVIEQWNATQKTYLEKYIESIPQIISLDQLHEKYVDIHFISKPNVQEVLNSLIVDKNEIVRLIQEINNYNTEMLGIARDFLYDFLTHNLTDCGFEKRLDGTPLRHPRPKHDIDKDIELIIRTNQIGKFLDEITSFSKEQTQLLNDYFSRTVPELSTTYFYDDDGLINVENENLEIMNKKIINRRDIDLLAAEIQMHNKKQHTILHDLRSKLEIVDLGFKKRANGLPLYHARPNVKIDEITSMTEMLYWEEKIKLFNREQREILESYVLRMPKVEDYGVHVPGMSKPKSIHHVVEHLKNNNDIATYINEVEKWNKAQKEELLKK